MASRRRSGARRSQAGWRPHFHQFGARRRRGRDRGRGRRRRDQRRLIREGATAPGPTDPRRNSPTKKPCNSSWASAHRRPRDAAARRGALMSSPPKSRSSAAAVHRYHARKGSRFTIRLPFTLAISQALIVRSGRIMPSPWPPEVRLARKHRSPAFGQDAPPFEYGGQKYRAVASRSWVWVRRDFEADVFRFRWY